MADPENKEPTIIIKKIKKGGHGHHGGAWKVAYADFVTAMMAFFLLMWLLNATDEETKRGISNYFSPVGTLNSGEGSGGMFGGISLSSEGAMRDTASTPAAGPSFGQSEQKKSEGEGDQKKISLEESDPNVFKQMQAAQEEKLLQAVEQELRESLSAIPELANLGENLIIDLTDEGLRIQIVDQNKVSMFPTGSDVMYEHTYKILKSVTKVINKLDNTIAIYGHTDGRPFKNSFNYGNWELSSDRAHATRRALIDVGVDERRIQKVSGRSSHDPLIKKDPMAPQNRRISIVLMRKIKKDKV